MKCIFYLYEPCKNGAGPLRTGLSVYYFEDVYRIPSRLQFKRNALVHLYVLQKMAACYTGISYALECTTYLVFMVRDNMTFVDTYNTSYKELFVN